MRGMLRLVLCLEQADHGGRAAIFADGVALEELEEISRRADSWPSAMPRPSGVVVEALHGGNAGNGTQLGGELAPGAPYLRRAQELRIDVGRQCDFVTTEGAREPTIGHEQRIVGGEHVFDRLIERQAAAQARKSRRRVRCR